MKLKQKTENFQMLTKTRLAANSAKEIYVTTVAGLILVINIILRKIRRQFFALSVET